MNIRDTFIKNEESSKFCPCVAFSIYRSYSGYKAIRQTYHCIANVLSITRWITLTLSMIACLARALGTLCPSVCKYRQRSSSSQRSYSTSLVPGHVMSLVPQICAVGKLSRDKLSSAPFKNRISPQSLRARGSSGMPPEMKITHLKGKGTVGRRR